MTNKERGSYKTNIHRLFLMVALGLAGALIVYLCSLFQQAVVREGDTYASRYLLDNYTWLVRVALFVAGLAAGFWLRIPPLLSGVGLILVYPVVSIAEAIMYKGSHNLIGIEFIIYLFYALPPLVGAYLGRFLGRRFHPNV